MATETRALKINLGTYGNTQAFVDGVVAVPGVEWEYSPIKPVWTAFKNMVMGLEFDISEMAATTFMVAKAYGKPITGVPIIMFRKFHQRVILCNVSSGIEGPKDLEGKRVGMRAYAQTGPTWSRGILNHEYGVDLGKVKWVTFEGSHVEEYKDPEHVMRAPAGKKMDEMLISGELDAAIFSWVIDSPAVKPLWPDGKQEEINWFRRTGIYPVNHMMVVKSELVAKDPGIIKELYAAFNESKRIFLDKMAKEGPATDEERDVLELQEMVGGDPLPHGIEANRKAYEALAGYAYEQGLLPKPYKIEDLFEPAVLALG